MSLDSDSDSEFLQVQLEEMSLGLVGFFPGFRLDFLGGSSGKRVSEALGWSGELEGK